MLADVTNFTIMLRCQETQVKFWLLCKSKGRFWASPAWFRTCFTGPRDYFFASLWKDELKATEIFQGHTDPLAIMKRYYLGLNSLQEILPAVLLSKQLPKHLPISFAISDNIFIQKSYRTSSTCSFESSMFYLLFLFVLFQSLWNRNWSATGNSFQHNIVP